MKHILISILTVITLSGCAGALPWNKQNYAGINEVSFSWCKANDGATYMPCNVKITNGKENGGIKFAFEMPDGTILNFSADDVKAFEGQNIRAKVEKAIAEQLGDVAPEVAEAIIKAITGK